MGVIPGLSVEVEAALVEIGQLEDGDYRDLIGRAVFAFRDELLALTPCVQTTV